MTFDDMVAQLAHVGWGIVLTQNLARVMPLGYAALTIAAIAVGKECIESIWGAWEPVQPWKSSLIDMAFWFIGIGAGAVLVAI